jgi:hypothetical protein
MARFEDHVEEVERTLRRSLTADELRLLKLWELTGKDNGSNSYQDAPPPMEAQERDAVYEGRFKIAFAKGQYEIYFVCATMMLHPVMIQNKEDVVLFLTQDPIYLNELAVRQATAAAESLKPIQINQTVSLPEPLLRSMGFRHR